MKLSDSDLQQLDPTWVLGLTALRKDKLLVTLIEDLKEARERLAANSQNSSRPPRTDAPWASVSITSDEPASSPTRSGTTANKPLAGAASAPKDAQTAQTSPEEGQASAPPATVSEKRKSGASSGGPRSWTLPHVTDKRHPHPHGQPLRDMSGSAGCTKLSSPWWPLRTRYQCQRTPGSRRYQRHP